MKKKFSVIIIIFLAFFYFLPTLSYYFVQDDFFHFKMSQVSHVVDFAAFFSPNNKFGYRFYRPLSVQTFFFLGKILFGLNPLGYRVIMMVFFLANIYLVFRLVTKLTDSENIGLLAGFFYSFSSLHFTTLSYLSTFGDILVSFLFFLTITLYLEKIKFAPVFFVLALMSRETAVALPLVLMVLEFFGKKNWKRLFVYFGILGIYGLSRLIFFGFPQGDSYIISLSPKSFINSLFWYTFWAVGAPENLIDFIGPGFRPVPRFAEVFGLSGWLIISGTLSILVFLAFAFFRFFIKDKYRQCRSQLIFFLFWFLATLAPMLLWPQHKFAFYLEISLLGFCALLAIGLYNLPRIWRYLTIIVFTVVSALTVNFYQNNYWVVGRSRLSQRIISEIKRSYPELPKGAVIFFENDPQAMFVSKEWGGTSGQARVAISDCNALRILYNDDSLECYFEDDQNPPNLEKVYSFVVKN